MKYKLPRGTTSKKIKVFIQDSTSTTGAGLTGLAWNTASLAAYYIREGDSSATAITLATATLGTWTSGGFIVVDGTNMPGVYEVGIPDAALSTGNSVVLMLRGAANMVPSLIEIELDAVNYQSATNFGLTNLDALISSRMATFTLPTNFASLSIDASGRTDLGKWIGTAPLALSSQQVQSVVPSSTVVASVTGGVTVTTNNDKTQYTLTTTEHAGIAADTQTGLTAQGYTTVRAGYLDVLNGIAAAIWNTVTSGMTTVGTIGKLLVTNIDAAISSRSTFAAGQNVGTATSVTGAVGSVTAGVTLTAGEHTNITADVLSATATSYNSAGTIGQKINAAASAGDPWSTTLPGAYGANTAGNIVGNRLDAAVSTRSTFAAGQNVGAAASVTAGVTVTTNNDKTGYALTAGEHTNIATDTQTGLTAQGYTTTRAPYLDTLNGLVAAIWNAATSGFATAGSIGLKLKNWALGTDNKALISTDAQTGVTIPTVTTVTGGVTVTTNNDKTGYTASTVSDKTGYSLSATGLDAPMLTDATSNANARSSGGLMLRAIFDRFFNKSTVTATTLTAFNDAGTAIGASAVSDDGTTATTGKSA